MAEPDTIETAEVVGMVARLNREPRVRGDRSEPQSPSLRREAPVAPEGREPRIAAE